MPFPLFKFPTLFKILQCLESGTPLFSFPCYYVILVIKKLFPWYYEEQMMVLYINNTKYPLKNIYYFHLILNDPSKVHKSIFVMITNICLFWIIVQKELAFEPINIVFCTNYFAHHQQAGTSPLSINAMSFRKCHFYGHKYHDKSILEGTGLTQERWLTLVFRL